MKIFKQLFIFSVLIFSVSIAWGQQQQQRQRPQQGQAPQQAQGQMPQSGQPNQAMRQRMPEDSTIRMTHFQTEIWDPEVPYVQPAAKIGDAPADAIVLFDGTNIDKEWEETTFRGGVRPATWVIKDGAMVSVQGSGSLKSKRVFNNFQLHIEWKTPSEITGSSQGRGNSGVYLQDLYELQILDSWHNRTYRNGQAGAFYKQYAPLVNASLKPGEWQSYDIVYTAPTFEKDSTSYFTPPRATVFQNGILIQNNVALRGPTTFVGIPEYLIKKHGAGSIQLQQHGNPVAFRNIWIREL